MLGKRARWAREAPAKRALGCRGAHSRGDEPVNPAGWPDELVGVFESAITAEYCSLTATGRPVTVPTTPYLGRVGTTLDVSTGLTYPAKAERARREPRVALLFADPVGSSRLDPPVVLVQGLATVRDSDLQANTDRYVQLSTEKLPEATMGPRAVLRRMSWYYARIWIEITPLHIRWWPSRALDAPAQEWHAPEGTAAPLSDPPPPGTTPGAWIRPPTDWRPVAEAALPGSLADLSTIDANGFPLCVPVTGVRLVAGGMSFDVGPGAPALGDGPACLTVHRHAARFTGQENHTFVGRLEQRPEGWHLGVERALGDWSLAGGRLRVAAAFLSKGRHLRRRTAQESLRRSQPVPEVRFPVG